MIKIHGGTPKSTRISLCETCRHSLVARGEHFEILTHCNVIGENMYFKVASCNEYDNKGLPSLREMEKVAWEVQSRNRGSVGFVGAKKGHPEEQPDLEITITPPKPKRHPWDG